MVLVEGVGKDSFLQQTHKLVSNILLCSSEGTNGRL